MLVIGNNEGSFCKKIDFSISNDANVAGNPEEDNVKIMIV